MTPRWVALVLRFASGLRYRWLFLIFATLFAADLVIPDAVPFVDELMLGLGTLLLASLPRRDGRGPSDKRPPDRDPAR